MNLVYYSEEYTKSYSDADFLWKFELGFENKFFISFTIRSSVWQFNSYGIKRGHGVGPRISLLSAYNVYKQVLETGQIIAMLV